MYTNKLSSRFTPQLVNISIQFVIGLEVIFIPIDCINSDLKLNSITVKFLKKKPFKNQMVERFSDLNKGKELEAIGVLICNSK